MGVYPDKIAALSSDPKRAGRPAGCNAEGVAAGFECGCFVRIFLEIDSAGKEVADAGFHTSGCGFAVAAADVLCRDIGGRHLTDFRGRFDSAALRDACREVPETRAHCVRVCEEALAAALADFRAAEIRNSDDAAALVCSCFGVSENAIRLAIETSYAETIEEIGDLCRAGTGCGSCRMVISEMLDGAGQIE